MQALLDRLAALENRSKPTVSSLKKGILQYALRQTSDFDKYIALEKIETLKIVSKDLRTRNVTIMPARMLHCWKELTSPQIYLKIMSFLSWVAGTMRRS